MVKSRRDEMIITKPFQRFTKLNIGKKSFIDGRVSFHHDRL
ncbi:hypothetical protein Cabys_1036 [Caldithrix abyssi DSM 13497]|uniref:Uncharacterized protein n=1 Tax=Caldithrix abyssi DSM 13497 TaxID=880073 RepID=A0A1J1C657_CALAY|nr:hypothetical protein Cabys_1036 [Caldithrix abyssi DSM 13497]